MEKYTIGQDITVFYVEADTFPEGVGAAFQKMFSFLLPSHKRRFYGISYPNPQGNIIYKAAVEEAFPGEGKENGFNTYIIKKGEYCSELVPNWKKDESVVGKTFQQLLKHPHLDPQGYCLEIYVNERDVRCLVPLVS